MSPTLRLFVAESGSSTFRNLRIIRTLAHLRLSRQKHEVAFTMTPMQQQEFDRARRAYEIAWGEMQKYGTEALDALKRHEDFGSASGRLFQDVAERAFTASENWRRAAELAREVMQEIASGLPRGTRVCYRCGCDSFQGSAADPETCDHGSSLGVPCGHRRDEHI